MKAKTLNLMRWLNSQLQGTVPEWWIINLQRQDNIPNINKNMLITPLTHRYNKRVLWVAMTVSGGLRDEQSRIHPAEREL